MPYRPNHQHDSHPPQVPDSPDASQAPATPGADDASETPAAKPRPSRRKPRPARLLLVDPDTALRQPLELAATPARPMSIAHAATLAEAHEHLSAGPIDLAVICSELPDGSGLELADHLAGSRKMTHTILVTDAPSVDTAVRAMRAGASDLIVRPHDLAELSTRVRKALSRQSRDKVQHQRVRRLRRLCRKLNQARVDVTEQVDALCEDLVSAYHELAEQIQQQPPVPAEAEAEPPASPPESPRAAPPELADWPGLEMEPALPTAGQQYEAVIAQELDLEQLIRKTLEHLVNKSGATNAAIFLPASMDEYALGGYVNFDVAQEAADLVLTHLADVLAPRLSTEDRVIHLTQPHEIAQWLGDDAIFLRGREVLTFSAGTEDESLAVITLFRNREEPYDRQAIEACEAVAPRLGEALAKLIKIHHRHLPGGLFQDTDDEEEMGFGPTDDDDGLDDDADSACDGDLPF